MYEAGRDPYCYRDSDVLKNKAGLIDQAALEEFETAMTFARSLEPLPAGRFTVTHYCAVHRHLFQDVYPWAGRFRRVRIAKKRLLLSRTHRPRDAAPVLVACPRAKISEYVRRRLRGGCRALSRRAQRNPSVSQCTGAGTPAADRGCSPEAATRLTSPWSA